MNVQARFRFARKLVPVVWLGLLLCGCSPKALEPKIATRESIKNFYKSIQYLELESGLSVEENLSKRGLAKAELNPSLVKIFRQMAFRTGVTTSSVGLFVDGWGQPFVIDWKSNVEEIADPVWSEKAIIIWSVGPNGEDERGFGDDLVSGKRGPPAGAALKMQNWRKWCRVSTFNRLES